MFLERFFSDAEKIREIERSFDPSDISVLKKEIALILGKKVPNIWNRLQVKLSVPEISKHAFEATVTTSLNSFINSVRCNLL